MSLIFIISILIDLVALSGTLVLLRRLKDWRVFFVTLVLGAVFCFQIHSMFQKDALAITLAAEHTDWMWLLESFISLLAMTFVVSLIVDRKKVAGRLAERELQYKSLYDHNPDAIYTLDLKGNFITSNQAAVKLTGIRKEELPTVNFSELVVPEDMERITKKFRLTTKGETQEYDITILNRLGKRIDLSVKNIPMYVDDKIVGVYGIAKDITLSKQSEEHMRRIAYYDPLTELPNRMLFEERLSQELIRAGEHRHLVAVFVLDLDRFKYINDTVGHAVGDRLLVSIAKRLNTVVRPGDTVARLGGDEFTILLTELADTEDAVQMAEATLDSLSKPFYVEGNEFFVTTSIGVSLYPYHGIEMPTLIKHAYTAMDRAKEQGRNNYQLYTSKMNRHSEKRLLLENELRKALDKDQLLLYYQPQVNIQTGQMVGMEALIRWNHPRLGRVSPGEFIPLAEDTGLIVPIGEWVLRTACAQIKAWHRAGNPHLSIAVNLSARQFQKAGLVDVVAKVLEETGLEPQYLDLEITESITMSNVDQAIVRLHELNNLGVEISIDDFGTGYSSLSYLKHFPIHKLKIDQSFVRDITTDPDDAAIARSIIAMAHSLKLNVIAEGVETADQLAYLVEQGCHEVQGYYFSPPLPAKGIEELLQSKELEKKVTAGW